MKKKKASKPDAAERKARQIAEWTKTWDADWLDTEVFRAKLAARIRRAIKAAVRAAKEER